MLHPLPDDISKLPHRDKDAVLTLYCHYFLAAELMLKNYKRLVGKYDRSGKVNANERVQLPIYLFTWLGFLGVTAEGFKDLGIYKLVQDARPAEFAELLPGAGALGKLLKKHDDALRRVRNTVFHLRKNTEDVEHFFYEQRGRLEWAEELQAGFREFFSGYRVLCQAYYALGNRSEEIFK
jgi:hypothetical protein